MLQKIKDALQLSANDLDDELMMYILACKNDLMRVGISPGAITDTDAVIFTLCVLYCKSRLNYHGDGERYEAAYRYMRDGYSMFGSYIGAANV